MPARGILVQDNAGLNTITFSGAQKRINSGANAGVTLANNASSTITFPNGGLNITTTSGAGFTASGGAAAIEVMLRTGRRDPPCPGVLRRRGRDLSRRLLAGRAIRE